jgi:hypothetical protein
VFRAAVVWRVILSRENLDIYINIKQSYCLNKFSGIFLHLNLGLSGQSNAASHKLYNLLFFWLSHGFQFLS